MDYLHEPVAQETQLESLLDEELSVLAPFHPCNQGAVEPMEEALKAKE